MNDHSRRLLVRVQDSIVKYTENMLDKYGLLRNLSGNIGALEEKEIAKEVERIATEIEVVLWTHNDEEGRERIIALLEQVKQMLK